MNNIKRVKTLNKSIEAKRHTPQYKMHKYFARRPYNVFNNLVSHYTTESDIVLDCFCGGGVTVHEAASLGRKVVGVDINPLATFITRMQMFNGDIKLLKKTYGSFIDAIKEKYNHWYFVYFENDYGICEWIEWVYVVCCPYCKTSIPLTNEYKIKNGLFKCTNMECKGHDGVKRIECIPDGSIPIRARFLSDITGKVQTRQISSTEQLCKYESLESIIERLKHKPNFKIPMDWDRQYEDKLKERGILEYKDFFTKRNYAINCCVFNDIINMKASLPHDIYEMLYFLFSSSLRYTNRMTRVTDNWESGKPTAMDKHAYWFPNQYIETNIVDIIEKRAKNIISGVKYAKDNLPLKCKEVFTFQELLKSGGYLVLNRSSTDLPIPDKSVDVIITDPPYGSNVQYAELSTVWNAWYELFNNLNGHIFKDEEAVVNRKLKFVGAKTESDYEELLYRVYSECNRVLKNDGYMIFTFNNKNIKVWISMMKAVARAGFYLPDDGVIFQDFIDSYKNTTHLKYAGNIHGDFIYSFVKGKNPVSTSLDGFSLQHIIEQTIDRQIQQLYETRKNYTTTELYQKIFSKLVCILMAYIVENIEDKEELLKVEMYSNGFVDNLLKKKLDYENDVWVQRSFNS